MVKDDAPAFVAKLESLFGLDGYCECGKTLCPSFVMRWIISVSPMACATALLEGQTCVSVDLNFPIGKGLCPLYFAALFLDYDLVDLFIRHGARADITNALTMEKNSLPLKKALEELRYGCHITFCLYVSLVSFLLYLKFILTLWCRYHLYLCDWTAEDSIFKLIIILCLPQMVCFHFFSQGIHHFLKMCELLSFGADIIFTF